MHRLMAVGLLCFVFAASVMAADLTQQQKQELLQKYGDARAWNSGKLKDGSMKMFLPASTPFVMQHINDGEKADFPFVWLADGGRYNVSRSVDGFLNSGEKVKVGIAKFEKDAVRVWVGRQTANEAVNVRAFIMIRYSSYEQLVSRINEVIAVQ